MPAIIDTTINWDSNITKVLATESGGSYEEYTNSGITTPLMANKTYTATVTLNSGYILDSVTSNSTNTTISDITENSFTFINSVAEPIVITLTSKQSTSKVSIDLTTLTGWDNVTAGEHQISVIAKATGYRDSEKSTAVSFTRAVINPTYQIVQGTSPTTALPYSSDNKNDLPTSINQSVKTVFDNYSTMTFEDILSTLRVDTSSPKKDQNNNEVDLTQYQKLTDTCSIFFVKDGDKKYYDYTDNINLEVINLQSSNLNGIDLDTTPTYCVSIEVDTGLLKLFSFSNISSSGTGDISTQGDNILGVVFLISKKPLLESDTYQFIETPNMNISIDETISGKMYTLTTDNTYGEQTSFDGISVVDSAGQIGIVFIGNSTSGNQIQCVGGDWKYVNTDGDEYTTTDTSKLRTIVLETDQYVSQEFYDWAITQGNLVKVEQSTGETWVLNDVPDGGRALKKTTINFTSNGQSFVAIEGNNSYTGPQSLYYYTNDTSYTAVCEYGTWNNTAYKTITFETAPTGDLLTWLQANGTKQ